MNLSNLDAKLRVTMRAEIAKITRNIGATTIYVTHDQTEAMTLADRIVIMSSTKILMVLVLSVVSNKLVPLKNFIMSQLINLLPDLSEVLL